MNNSASTIIGPASHMSDQCYTNVARFAAGGDDIDPTQKFHWFITGHVSHTQQVNIYKMCSYFRNRIDGLMATRRHHLYKMLWIEQGAQLHSKARNTAHTHWLFEQPSHLSPVEFQIIFKRLWAEIAGSTNIDIRPIRKELGGINGIIEYCGKEAELGNFGTFFEICSDNARSQNDRQAFLPPSLFKST